VSKDGVSFSASGPIPRVILGTARLGSVLPDAFLSNAARERAFRYLDGMLQVGCSAFDLAASYMLGGTERLIGAWIHSRHNRDQLFLITKGAHPYPIVQPHRVTPSAISGDLYASLRRLRTDRVDLYLLHRDDPAAPLEPIVATLADHQRQGRIGAWGVSNWSHGRIRALDALARSAGLPSVAASSPHFSLAEWTRPPWKGSVSLAGDDNREARAFYESSQLPVLAWSALGQGFFSRPRLQRRRGIYGGDGNLSRKQRAEALAESYRMTPAQIALAYLFQQPFPVSAIVSASTAEKMRSNLEATGRRLTNDEVRWLESGDSAKP
jgi:aryl-alcohol dehydrogenase-like predicted oxidoreductase